MSAGRHPRPAPLLLTNAEIPDVPVHPVPGTVLKIPGAPDQRAILTDNQAKMRSLIILDKDIPVLCGNGFSLFAGKGAVRQPLKYSEIFAHPQLSGDAPHWTGRLSLSVVRRVGRWFEVISPAAPRQTVRAVFPHTAFRLSSSCRITASQGVRTD